MLVVQTLPNGMHKVHDPLSGLAVTAPTAEEAARDIITTLKIKAMAERRLRIIKKLTVVQFDPSLRRYTADYFRGALVAQGDTRQEAWDNLLQAIALSDQAMRAAAKDAALAAEADTLAVATTDEIDLDLESHDLSEGSAQ